MQKTLLLFTILTSSVLMAQIAEYDAANIFNHNSDGRLIIKPEYDQKIRKAIKPLVEKKLKKFKNNLAKEHGDNFDEKFHMDDLRFAADTIFINEYLSEYDGIHSVATTTLGMVWKSGREMDEYDKHLNDYYQKAKTVLTDEGQKKLVSSQKRWLDYYENEKDLLYSLNDVGNHNTSLYTFPMLTSILKERVYFLRDIYNKRFTGLDLFIDPQ